MSVIEKLKWWYHGGSDELWVTLLNRESEGPLVFEGRGHTAILLWTNVVDEAVTTGEPTKAGPYIAFDDCLSFADLMRAEELTEDERLRWVPQGLPKLMYLPQMHTFEEYRDAIQTNAKIKRGSRWQAVDHSWQYVGVDAAQQVVERKRAQYPMLTWDIVDYYRQYHAGRWIRITGVVHGALLYEMLAVHNEEQGLLYGIVINVSEVPEYRRLYSPYVMGHLRTLELAYELRCRVLDFGMYYPYKSIFGVPPVWYPGVRWKSNHA